MQNLKYLDEPPRRDGATDYDRQHATVYLRLLDAEAEGANWQEVVAVIFDIDPHSEPGRARRVYDSHLARARFIATSAHRDLLDQRTTKR